MFEIDETILNYEKSRVNNPDRDPNNVYIFTDGAAKGVGKAHCRATYAYYIVFAGDDSDAIYHAAPVPLCPLPGLIYQTSHIRGELLGIYHGLRALKLSGRASEQTSVTIVSDSMLSINTIDVWYENWVKKDIVDEHANSSLITTVFNEITECRKIFPVKFAFQKAHLKTPVNNEPLTVFKWAGNKHVDTLAATRNISNT